MTDNQISEKFSPRIKDLLKGRDEILDIVLRGHLHVEQLFLSMIECWAVSPRYVENARLSFSQKLSLVRAFNFHHPDEPIWDALTALNSLRNDLAHRLTSEQRERKITAFIKLIDKDQKSDIDSKNDEVFTSYEHLLGCFAYLFGSLESMAEDYSMRASVVKSIGNYMPSEYVDREGNT